MDIQNQIERRFFAARQVLVVIRVYSSFAEVKSSFPLVGPEGFSNCPNPILLSAHIASMTGLKSIGLSCVTATIWHPLRLAEDLAMLDHMCRGRLRVGLGRGGYHRDTIPFHPSADPRNPDTSRALFGEAGDIVVKAWTEPFFSHKGQFYTLPPAGIPHHPMSTSEEPYVNDDGTISRLSLAPKPYQQPHPPIFVMVSSEGSVRAAAQRGFDCIVAGAAIDLIREWTKIYADIRSERDGRTYLPGECWSAQRPLCVAPTMAAARKSFEPYILKQRRYQALYRGIEGAKEYARKTLGGATEWTWEVLQEQTMMAGSPDRRRREVAGTRGRGDSQRQLLGRRRWLSARAGHGNPGTVRIRSDAEIPRPRVTVGESRVARRFTTPLRSQKTRCAFKAPPARSRASRHSRPERRR